MVYVIHYWPGSLLTSSECLSKGNNNRPTETEMGKEKVKKKKSQCDYAYTFNYGVKYDRLRRF